MLSLAPQRLYFHKDLNNSVSDIFIANAFHLFRLAWNWLSNFANQLLARFIRTDNRIVGVLRQMANLQNILHVGYKCRVSFWSDFPVLSEARLTFVFFNPLRGHVRYGFCKVKFHRLIGKQSDCPASTPLWSI